jgi:hypothetical protein
MSKKYIRKIGKKTNFQIIINCGNKKETDKILKMLIYLALDINSQNYLINYGVENE